MYKDITMHSRNDVKSEIRVLENEANGIRFVVHKHIDYGNEWLLSCYELQTEDMNEAKEKALVEMAEFFNKMVQKYKKAIEELKFKGGSL